MRGGPMLRWIAGAAVLAVVCYFAPLFHVVRIADVPVDKIDSAGEFLQQLWMRDLPAVHDQAIPLDELLPVLEADPEQAAGKYARQVGLSDARYYFARGKGTIVELTGSKALVRLDGSERQVCLKLGVITDSAVRDATGLVDVNRFSRLQDFNALSGKLNEKVETEVIVPVRDKLAVGSHVEFVGCAQVKGKRDLEPLCLTPIALDLVEEQL